MKKGFTLIELMIVITILGILVAIAYPSYQDSVIKARRVDGKTALHDLAQRMERYYSENHTYATATIGGGGATEVLNTATTPDGWYSLSITAQSATAYTLQATPQGAQAAQDTICANLTLTSTGVESASGSLGADCW